MTKTLSSKVLGFASALAVSALAYSPPLEAKLAQGDIKPTFMTGPKIDFERDNGEISYEKIYGAIYGSNRLIESKCSDVRAFRLPIRDPGIKGKVCVLDIVNLREKKTKRNFDFTIYTGVEEDKLGFKKKLIILEAYYNDNCVNLFVLRVPEEKSFDLSKTRLTGYAVFNATKRTKEERHKCAKKHGIYSLEGMQGTLRNALENFNSGN